MSDISQVRSYESDNFEMTRLECQHNSLKTLTNMLIARRWVSDDFDTHYNTLLGLTNEILDTTTITCNNIIVAVKFYNNKLNTLKNEKEIDTFITTYQTHHKILIVTDISAKIEKQIMELKNFEVYKLMDIVRDISQHHIVPKHILLTKEDAAKVMDEYKLKKPDMGRIYINDPMAKYLFAQKDDIIQIIRPNANSGYSTYYRLVVPNSIYS
jgi:DNA-directed RNA polymerase subunit H (RpoH/RPB5)